MSTYENSANNFQMQYPENWEKKEGVYGTVVAFVSPRNVADDFGENITVTVKQTSATAEQYVDSAVKNAPKDYKDFKLVENKATTLSGEPARMITYTFTEGTAKIYTREIFAVKGGKVYDITFTNTQDKPNELWDVGQKMVESFKITK
jgi:hypothetical protein